MALLSLDAFLELVAKSGVVDPARMSGYLDRLRSASSLPGEPGKLGGLMVRDGLLTQFQAEQLLAGKWRGFHVGKYKVLEKLGSGGMGTVYLAEHKIMRRRVALKVLPKAKAQDASSLERFQREAKAIAALDHPNIVRAYDIDQDGELHYLVMEYVDGASLQDIVKITGPLPCDRAANYIMQAAEGLHHAHLVGLVHRDIKPGNLLVDRFGVLKILDMGLARFFHDEEDILTKKYDENVLGTADYLAPEQALDSHNVDIRADIYSLGGTFYYLLTGRSPFGEGTVAQKLIWHQTRRPKPLKELRPDVPDDLVAVIDRMMNKAQAERFQIPEEVAKALQPLACPTFCPPPEEVMPRLSPAAVGPTTAGGPSLGSLGGPPSNAPVAFRKPAGGPNTPSSGSALRQVATPGSSHRQPSSNPTVSNPNQETGRNPPSPSSRRTESTAPVVSSGGPVLASPVATVPAPFAPAEDNLGWQAVVDTSPSSFSSDDTPVTSKRRSDRKGLLAYAQANGFSRKQVILFSTITGVVLIAIAVILFIVFGKKDSGTGKGKHTNASPTSPAGARNRLIVSRSGGDGEFASIGAAMEHAQSGDDIIVKDQGVYEEQLQFTAARGWNRRDVTIEAEVGSDGRAAILRAPSKMPATEPLLSIEGVVGLKLKGFLLDGQKRIDTVVRVAGACPGLALENLRITAFKRTGISFEGAQGTARDKAIVVKGSRIETRHEGGPLALAGVNFGPFSKSNPGWNRYIMVQDCRLEGPFESAVRVSATVGTPPILPDTPLDTSIERCVIFGGAKNALLLASDIPANSQVIMLIANNTISDFDNGLLIQANLNWSSDLIINNNLFYKIKSALVQLDKVDAEKVKENLKGDGNVYHASETKPGAAGQFGKLAAKPMAFDLPTSDKDAIGFLRYGKLSPLATAGFDKSLNPVPVGALDPQP